MGVRFQCYDIAWRISLSLFLALKFYIHSRFLNKGESLLFVLRNEDSNLVIVWITGVQTLIFARVFWQMLKAKYFHS